MVNDLEILQVYNKDSFSFHACRAFSDGPDLGHADEINKRIT